MTVAACSPRKKGRHPRLHGIRKGRGRRPASSWCTTLTASPPTTRSTRTGSPCWLQRALPSLFNMFGVPGTQPLGAGADLQAKHRTGIPRQDGKAWRYPHRSWHAVRSGAHGRDRPLHGRPPPHPLRRRQSQAARHRPLLPVRARRAGDRHRPRHAFQLASTLTCSSLVFCGGKDTSPPRPSRARCGRLHRERPPRGVALLLRRPDHGFAPPGQCRLRAALRRPD